MFVRNIIYMQLCVTAEMKYNQFQFSTLLFIIGYLGIILNVIFIFRLCVCCPSLECIGLSIYHNGHNCWGFSVFCT